MQTRHPTDLTRRADYRVGISQGNSKKNRQDLLLLLLLIVAREEGERTSIPHVQDMSPPRTDGEFRQLDCTRGDAARNGVDGTGNRCRCRVHIL
jgi:hypothetical protein